MTAYLVRYDQSPVGWTDVAFKAGSYECRLVQVNLFGSYSAGTTWSAVRYESGTMSGGTTIPIVALRQGAPACTAAAMFGNALTFTGTARTVGGVYLPPGEVSTSTGTSVINTFPGASAQITFPLTTIVSPGTVFTVHGAANNVFGCDVYFEELRLSGSY